MNLAAFFAQIAPQLGTTAEQLQAYANEDAAFGIGGYVPGGDKWIVGSMWEVEGQALYAIIRALKPQRILEIGTRRGCSTTHILTAMEVNGFGELVSLDIEPFLGDIPEHLQHRWTFVQTDALAWMQRNDGMFDIVFEDGAHSYDFTRDALALSLKFSARMTISHDAAHHIVGKDIRAAWHDVFGAGMYTVALIEPADCGYAYRFGARARAIEPDVTPLVSIVSGTYNRLDYLIGMIESVRRQLPEPVAYEFVIVDGGSTDGTIEWCKRQPDIRLIEQGALLGAIRAFDAGCEAARGEYVCLLNDDVLVGNGALLRAIAHLEATPDCGAVAFADNRQDGSKNGGYGVGVIPGISPDGRRVNIHYAQCGVFRRWLGDLAGWWGSHDETWGAFHTYGGDNRLSARIWEMGYNVDAVEGCVVHDRIAPDSLRERNHQAELGIGSAYMRVWGNGVQIASQPRPDNPQGERLRILMATLYDRGFGHYKRGLRDAFSRVGAVVEVDYLMHPEQLVRMAWAWQPHIVFAQMCDPALMKRVRDYAPDAVIVNWNGDVHRDVLLSPQMLQQCRYTDLMTVVNADVLPEYAKRGIAAAFWEIGFEPVPDTLPAMPKHDVLFLGSSYSPARAKLGKFLKELPHNVGIYGYNWGELGSGSTLYDFAAGAALYRNCKIAIGDNQYQDKAFVSNRLFEALANGAFLLHQRIPDLEAHTGLVEGVHYVSWTDLDDLRGKIAHYLTKAGAKERAKIAKAGEKFVRERHSFDARVKQLFEELLPNIVTEGKMEHGRTAPVGRGEEFEAWADGVPR